MSQQPTPRFGIGEPVEIALSYHFSDDWRGVPLWVCKVEQPAATDHLLYGVTEHWPPRTLGDITDDFREEDLMPRKGAR